MERHLSVFEAQVSRYPNKNDFKDFIFIGLDLKPVDCFLYKNSWEINGHRHSYILVVARFNYKYRNYTNTQLRLIAILDDKNNLQDSIIINEWKLIKLFDGYKDSSNENTIMRFATIDKLGERGGEIQLSIGILERLQEEFKEVDAWTSKFHTFKEYKFSNEIQKLEEIKASRGKN